MSPFLRRFIAAVILLGLFAPAAFAATFKIATAVPDGTTWMKEMRAGAKEIGERTGGRVKFKFYPGGVMGNDKSVMKKIRLGQLQGGALTGGSMSLIFPEMQIYDLPMLFRSYAEIDHVRSKIDPLLKEGLAGNGFVCLGISEGGFVYLMSSEPVRSIEDLKSHKVWMPEGDRLTEALFKRMGVPPIPLSLADVYTGLQTGLIDTVESIPTGALAFQWHTRIGAVTEVPLSYLVGGLVVEKKRFEKLKPEDQKVVREVMDRIFARMDDINRADNEKAMAALGKQGIQFVKPSPAEVERWKGLAEETIKASAANIVNSEIYRKMLKMLEEKR
ncbi:MAG: TRAP transporter substrate-binding protein DctP [Pseudomonadota bacterium]|nr:TRAP transporter substrate-binding protein DctP [Pseudomonadota bacterium]